jgi:hypothetical protein
MAGGGNAGIRVSWYASDDGSGSQLSQSAGATTSSTAWTWLDTGPIQAPADAQSARVRLVLTPDGSTTACFDDAAFVQADAPAATPTPVPSASGAAPSGPAGQSPATATRAATQPARSSGGPAPVVTNPGSAQPGLTGSGLRISEFLSDPEQPGRDAEYEWVELVNVSTETVDLSGWKLGDGTSSQALPSASVAPGGYVVVAGSGATFDGSVLVVHPPSGTIGNGLGNDGDMLRLFSPSGDVIDEISYGANVKVFDPAPDAPDTGQTLGLTDPSSDPASENWAITLHPTPGEPNVFPTKAKSTAVAGAKTPVPDGVTESAGLVSIQRGGGGISWPMVILIALASVSLSIAGVTSWGRIKEMVRRAPNA